MALTIQPKLDIEKASERLLCHLSERCRLPSVAHEILTIESSAGDRDAQIRDCLQHDAALVIGILRHLNSSSYCIDTKVSEIKTAVEVLGFAEIRNLAFVIILGRFFSNHTAHGLWTHCVSVGSAARLISRVCGVGQPSELFFAGLMHDLGILFLDLQLNRSFHTFVSSFTSDDPNDIQERR